MESAARMVYEKNKPLSSCVDVLEFYRPLSSCVDVLELYRPLSSCVDLLEFYFPEMKPNGKRRSDGV